PGVLVGLFSLAGEGAMATEATDVNGAFEIRGVRPASYIVIAFGDETMHEMGQNVTVADKDITDMLIEIERGVTVRGRVEPPMAASLGLSTPDVSIGNMFAMMKSAMVNAKSDENTGEFTLLHVPSGSFAVNATTKEGMK